ncbi:site-specific DNA-methyltransferase [Pseudomonas syringae]|uniref:DNA-methyltransferase n=4 Tax=Pseudomonas syringae TaxID=317 RepID=UPI001F42FFF8|nr:site-specific DNA-methyltransferase [Pseudomonas syringae]MCF5179594.1 site-specific DNA-methyltransferase [Pseudomonas syringae]MCF5312522.1 site-specific DNA-methyltransferase [Pseudomonas syringae]MCF5361135.1 site-specific DNA-methyltransferase [Pseudomonas syringae]MCF5392598.1 site-specific DNA-methyltransferase [Pseudomonas syringae]MCF5400582.1 site-specific DNA-methyltransferase [Pseudomonas syringae]
MSQLHQILVGDCIDMMRTLPDESVHTCVTSPPYYGLRDYGVDGQIGLEETPAEFIARLVDVFREVRRVLRADGTIWVNMGDSYASDSKWGGSTGGKHVKALHGNGSIGRLRTRTGLPDKNLMGMPWRLAFALQDDGWYLRQDIIWHKPNPMPESTRDRCTKAHEYLFLLSKSPRYYYDQNAIKEPVALSSIVRMAQDLEQQHGSDRVPGKANGPMKAVRSRRDSFKREDSKREQVIPGQTVGTHRPDRSDSDYPLDMRNKRSVWTVPTQGFKGAHFATFPPDLIRPCILAGAPRGGVVLDPFGGAGTTSLVSMQEGRRSIICELNPEYAALARARIDAAWLDGAAQMDVFRDSVPAA